MSNSPIDPLVNRKASVFDDPPRKNVLLLSCMDQRLLDDTVRFMNSLNLQNRYDQVALAGGALGANEKLVGSTSDWRPIFFEHLIAAISLLHRPIKDIFLLDHLDCGAYKYLHPDEKVRKNYPVASLDCMKKYHEVQLKGLAHKILKKIDDQKLLAEVRFEKARKLFEKDERKNKSCWEAEIEALKELVNAWTGIRVSYFVIDVIGKVTQLNVGLGERDTFECSK